MKKFRFYYSTSVWVLLSLVILLLTGGLCYNIYNFFSYVEHGVYKAVIYFLIVIVNGGLLAFAVSVAVYGKYVIKDKKLYSYFGFIRSAVSTDDIVQITHFKKSDKLVIYYKDAKYSVIIISPDKYEGFILALREENRNIIYDSQSDGEERPQ